MGMNLDAYVFYGILIGGGDVDDPILPHELNEDEWLEEIWKKVGMPFYRSTDEYIWEGLRRWREHFGIDFKWTGTDGWSQTFLVISDSVQSTYYGGKELKIPSSYELQLWYDKLSVFADLAEIDIKEAKMWFGAFYS